MSKPIEVHGFCDPGFIPIQEAFIKNFENELEIGASVALTADGEPVVDLWAGYSDRKKNKTLGRGYNRKCLFHDKNHDGVMHPLVGR
jgi:cytolysin (calcineurin-like family phosphatase)